MRAISWLMKSSLLPQSPRLWKGCLLAAKPPRGALSLKGQRKLLASLKCSPTVWISLTRSSTDCTPCLPRASATTRLSDSGMRCLLTFPQPRFRISLRMVSREGQPKVMQGSTRRSRFADALFTRTNTPLWICLSRRMRRIRRTFGFSLLIPRILTTKASLGWAGTWICPVSLACRRAVSSAWVAATQAASCSWAFLSTSARFALLSALRCSRSCFRAAAILTSLSSFFFRPQGLGGTCDITTKEFNYIRYQFNNQTSVPSHPPPWQKPHAVSAGRDEGII